MRWYIFPFLAIIFLSGCASQKDTVSLNGQNAQVVTPAGTVKISPNFYADQNEVSVLGYQEYIYWTGRIFGKESRQYRACMPDTSVWLGNLGWEEKLRGTYYFFSNQTYDFPMVGLSYRQAQAYCQWRTDRVYEAALVKAKAIDLNAKQDSNNYFTAEKYIAGIFPSKKSSRELHMPIAVYRLPDIAEWDSLAGANNPPAPNDKASKLYYNTRSAWFMGLKVKLGYPTRPYQYSPLNKHALRDVYGNVSEMLSTQGISKGGSWQQDMTLCRIGTFKYSGPTAWLGFRCVCSYMTPEEYMNKPVELGKP